MHKSDLPQKPGDTRAVPGETGLEKWIARLLILTPLVILFIIVILVKWQLDIKKSTPEKTSIFTTLSTAFKSAVKKLEIPDAPESKYAPEINVLFKQATAYHKAGDIQAAKQLYIALLEKQPDHLDALFNLAGLAYHAYEYAKAAEYYSRILALDPNNSDALGWKANALFSDKKFDALHEHIQTMLLSQSKPILTQAHFLQGLMQETVSENEEKALASYREALNIDPGYANAYLQIGNIYAARKNAKRALVNYQKTLELDPENYNAYHYRGSLYKEIGDYKNALADFNRAIDTYAKNYSSLFYTGVFARGQLFMLLGDNAHAIEDFETIIRQTPDVIPKQLPYIYYYLGQCYEKNQNYQQAKSSYRAFVIVSLMPEAKGLIKQEDLAIAKKKVKEL